MVKPRKKKFSPIAEKLEEGLHLRLINNKTKNDNKTVKITYASRIPKKNGSMVRV